MLWVKVFHIVTVIAWMAGLFYLPRIFVHHIEGLKLGEDVRRLGVMARKLFSFTTIMALQATVAGAWLWLGYGLAGGWLYAKLLVVAVRETAGRRCPDRLSSRLLVLSAAYGKRRSDLWKYTHAFFQRATAAVFGFDHHTRRGETHLISVAN